MRIFSVLAVMAAALVLGTNGCRSRTAIFADATGLQPHIDSVLPHTPAARQLSGLLSTCNSGELARMRSFGSSRAGPAMSGLTGRVISFYREARAVDVATVGESGPAEIVVQARSTVSDQWYRISLTVDATPSAAITSFNWLAIPAPAAAAKMRRVDREIVAEGEAYLERLSKADMFSGVILVAKGRKPIFEKAYGLADRDRGISNTIETQFDLASVTKLFTGVAIAQLAEEGRLSFSDTISRHLPDYPNSGVAQKVSIHQLLTHSSGMGDVFGSPVDPAKFQPKLSQDYFPFFAQTPLEFEPGSGVRYSNAGYLVLGAIVERVSGQTFFDYLRDHIFTAANMKHSGVCPQDAGSFRAVAYTFAESETQSGLLRREPRPPRLPYFASAAGGGCSTVEDLLNFVTALQDHLLLGKEQTESVMSGKVATRRGNGNKHAYGFADELVNDHRIVGHSGGYWGVNTQLDIYPDNDYVVIILSNYDPPAASIVANKLRNLLTVN
jgi:CubicO group peptidase (beta-lactamase class C family)